MLDSVVKRVEELATIDAQLYEDLTFEDRNNIPIEDTDNTTEGADTAKMELETPGVEVELINTGVENQNINEEETNLFYSQFSCQSNNDMLSKVQTLFDVCLRG